nr:reverse transcriptase domain-containing protein [Tanacetum cinerariifolium]
MSSDSHTTITYTSMSSYEVTINGYYGMPMDPLDPYVQLVIGAPPSPDYIPGPEAPPLPDYIPGPEYPEYLPPTDDMLPAEEQPLPAAVSTTAEISVQPHILMPFRTESEVERLLPIPTPPLSLVSLTSYTLQPLLTPLPIFTPLPTSSFPLPSSIPSTSGSKSIPEADIPLQERAHHGLLPVTRGPYEYISDSDGGFTEGAPTTRLNLGTTPVTTPSTTTTSVPNAQLQAMINEGVNAALAARDATRNGDDSHTSGTSTEGVVELTRWFKKMESVFSISNCIASSQVKFATCTLQDDALTRWNSYVKTTTPEEAYAMTWATLKKKMTGSGIGNSGGVPIDGVLDHGARINVDGVADLIRTIDALVRGSIIGGGGGSGVNIGNGIRNGGNGYDVGKTGDSDGVGMASNLSTFDFERNGIGICGRTDILAAIQYADGGGVAAVSPSLKGSV